MARRVVVTGVGMVTPLGNNAVDTWQNVLAGKSGTGPLTKFQLEGLDPQVCIAAEVKGFETEPVIDRRDAKRMDTFIQYALVATDEAMRMAGLGGLGPVPDPENTGTIIGSGMGGIDNIMQTRTLMDAKGPGRVSPFFIPASIINLAPGQVAMRTGATGPSYSPVSACASSNHAIGEAFHAIQRGDAVMMLAGGTEASSPPSRTRASRRRARSPRRTTRRKRRPGRSTSSAAASSTARAAAC